MKMPLMLLIAASLLMSGANRLNLKAGPRLVPHPMARQGPVISTHANLPHLLMQFDSASVGDSHQVDLCAILEHEEATTWLCDDDKGCQETQQMFLCTDPSPEMTCVLQEGLIMEGKPVWACAPDSEGPELKHRSQQPTMRLTDEYGSPAGSDSEASDQGDPAEPDDGEPGAAPMLDSEAAAMRNDETEGDDKPYAFVQSGVKVANLHHIEPASNGGDAASRWQGGQ